MKPDELVLAIDLGTSGPKVALVSRRGRVVSSASERTRLVLHPGGGAEQDPDDWWQAIVRATRTATCGGDLSARVGAICCTAQWSGTVPVGEDGRHLMNALIWLDSRGAKHLRSVTGGFPSIQGYSLRRLLRWLRLTGGVPTHSGKDPVAHIRYIMETFPDVHDRCFKYLEPKDFLNFRLTGVCRSAPDTIALHWVTDNRDLSRVSYDDTLIGWTGIDRSKFPDLGTTTDILGGILPGPAAELGIPAGIPVAMGTPDMHGAALGSGAVGDLAGHLYVGTSSWLSCHVPRMKTDILNNITTLPSARPDRWFVIDEQETSGACLNHLVEKILYPEDELESGHPPPDVFARLDSMASRIAPGCEGLYFTPWLYGERTPVDNRNIRGGFYNMSLSTTRSHLVRSILEGVAFNTRWLLGYVERFIGQEFPAINIIGGGATSTIWCQIFADILERPIRQVRDPLAANARGAAFLTLVALGEMSFSEIEGLVEIERTYMPDASNRSIYRPIFGCYLETYERIRRIHARLNAAG